jgi:hypothetical protein
LILTKEYELGFQNDSREGVQAYIYSPGVQREPLDQTDLKNDVDAILGGGEGSFWKRTVWWGQRGLGGFPHGSGGLL